MHDTETGLYYLRARPYDPVSAQFLALDPEIETTRAPYTYVGDSPVNADDPTGLGAEGMVLCVAMVDPLGGEIPCAAGIVWTLATTVCAGVILALLAKAAKNKSNTGKTYPNKNAAVKQAKRDARNMTNSGQAATYRGPDSSNDHVHVDIENGRGEITETRHYRWNNRQ